MDDLFGFVPDHYAAPAPDPHERGGVPGCRPWEGCDPSSEEWRAYTEGVHLVRRFRRRSDLETEMRAIERHRGSLGRKYLDQVIDIVRRDLAGDLHPRDRIGEMIAAIPGRLQSEASRAALKKRGVSTYGTERR